MEYTWQPTCCNGLRFYDNYIYYVINLQTQNQIAWKIDYGCRYVIFSYLYVGYSTGDIITVTSSSSDTNGSLAFDLAQQLVLTVTGQIIAEVNFIYKPNPIIIDVFPLQTIQT